MRDSVDPQLERKSSVQDDAVDREEGKGNSDEYEDPESFEKRHFAPMRSQSRSISRIRSQNGYGVDDDSEDIQADRDLEQALSKDPFEVEWDDGDKDPLNPRSKSLSAKWFIIFICATASLCATCTSSIYTSTYAQTTVEFGCSQLVATLGLSLFIMGLGLGPMFLGPLSEFYGRRPIFLVSFTFFFIWIIPSAVAKNIETMLIVRFFDGLAGSAFMSVSGGTVGDLFSHEDLQFPMMVFTAAPFIGPSVGPLIGGFINQYTTWRWTYYFLLIWSGSLLAAIYFFVPETYHPRVLKIKAQQKRKETGDDRWKAPMEKMSKSIPKTIALSLKRPMQLLIFEPMCLLLCLYSSILLGVLYLFFGAFGLIFTANHDFTPSQVGLSFLGIFVGMMAAISTDLLWHKNYVRLVRNREAGGGEPGGSEPEFRLPPAIFGAPLVTIGLFWFGWTTYKEIHWIIPIIGSGVFGMGMLLVFSGIFTFLVDAYPLYAASALAANSFTRSTFGAVFPLFGIQMYNKLGYQWATSLLAFLTVAMLPLPYLFFRHGKAIRARSRFTTNTR